MKALFFIIIVSVLGLKVNYFYNYMQNRPNSLLQISSEKFSKKISNLLKVSLKSQELQVCIGTLKFLNLI